MPNCPSSSPPPGARLDNAQKETPLPNENDKHFEARLPKTLVRKLDASAAKNERSRNAELIVAVRYYLTGAAPAETPAQPAATPTEA